MTQPLSDQAKLRYSRQIRFPQIGENGQAKLRDARVLLVGCGALGSSIADTLVRAGVGFLRIVDRDFLEISNLQRQVLFDENDVEQMLPKAVAAAEHLRKINSSVLIEPIVADVDAGNIEGFAKDVDLIMDGSDNFEIRFLNQRCLGQAFDTMGLRRLLGCGRTDHDDTARAIRVFELLDARRTTAAGNDSHL